MGLFLSPFGLKGGEIRLWGRIEFDVGVGKIGNE